MKRALFATIALIASVSIALLLSEGILRAIDYPPSQKNLGCEAINSELGKAYAASAEGRYSPNSAYLFCTPEYLVEYKIDSLGFIGLAGEDARRPTTLVFGDSFAFGLGVEPVTAFAHRMGAYNAGLWGRSYDTHAMAFERAISVIKPTNAVWVLYPPHLITISEGGWMSRRVIAQTDHPKLYRLVEAFNQTKMSALLIYATGVGWNRPNYETAEYALYDSADRSLLAGYSGYEAAVARITSVARRENIRLIPVFVPSKSEMALADGRRPPLVRIGRRLDPDLPAKRMAEVLERAGIPASEQVRLRPLIMQSAPQWSKLYFNVDVHWNASGHGLVATLLTRELNRIAAQNRVVATSRSDCVQPPSRV